MIVNTLIFIFGAILFVSAIVTLTVWFRFRHKLIRTLMYFWLSGILGYFAQGIFSGMNVYGLLAFGFNALAVNYLLRLYLQSTDTRASLALYNWILGVALLAGCAVIQVTGNYFVGSMIFCIACCVSLFHGAIKFSPKKNSNFFIKGYQGVLFFAGIHFLDYPYFRTHESLAVIGFAISIIFYFCFAIFVPILILQKMSSNYTRQLESEVAMRTRQVYQSYTQLKEAFENLKDSKAQINTLLSDNQIRMSALVHDMSNPLQIIVHSFSMINENPEKGTDILKKKTESIQAAIKSIRQILNEARQTHSEIIGKSELTLKKVNIRSMFEEVLKNFEHRITEKKLNLELDFNKLENLWALANDSWLKNQVLSNLISNAIKFTNVGGKIRISTSIMDGNRIAILIEDDGVGIPIEKRETIFTFDKKTSTRGTLGEEGSGLGLPIVKQYTELMGGKVILLNREAAGTSFQVELQKAAA